ncbi:CYFA0S10e00364g1_1 [Cyberlindnera fabianii]|uniref:CYFA0S10e00364g1_1 n=1 Tax=Cyberlindnera fabianii TaxID=36022 RepID=A0A061AYL5_CYBFA|nr:Mitochondrial peculiar membrane protein 1 [Cyberlindnera fabianii]CDR42621.1 CYFA0S10e00364g1_1 [Cyberlindnera fabianii]
MGLFTGSTSDKEHIEKTATEIASGPTCLSPSFPTSLPGFSSIDQRVQDMVDKVFDSKIFSSDNWKSWGRGWDETRPYLELFGNFHKGRGISGLKAYPVPNTSQYEECQNKKGLSVWDENGWWRCLFPRANLPQEGGVSREDVEGDRDNKYGVFFKEYNSLLDWKVQVAKLVREKEEQKRIQSETQTLNDIYADYEKDLDWDGVTGQDGVVSTSKAVHYKTLPNGDAEEVTEIHNTFRDGRSENKKFRKLIPREGSPLIEDLSSDKKDSKLIDWIWDNKKD